MCIRDRDVYSPTFFSTEINISPTGLAPTADVKSLRLKWNGQLISQIPVIGPRVETREVPAQWLSRFYPPNTGSDLDFGAWPLIQVSVNITPVTDAQNVQHLQADVFMQADGYAHPNAHVAGTTHYEVFHCNSAKEKITKIVSPTSTFDRTNQVPAPGYLPGFVSIDALQFDPQDVWNRFGTRVDFQPWLTSTTVNGLVKLWKIWGDHAGNDVGTFTSVQPYLNAIKVQVETNEGISQNTKTQIQQDQNAFELQQLASPLSAIIQKK